MNKVEFSIPELTNNEERDADLIFSWITELLKERLRVEHLSDASEDAIASVSEIIAHCR